MAAVGVTISLLTIYFLYLLYRIVLVWKKWKQALIRWKNTLVISVVFLIGSMALVYSSVDWKESLFVSCSKIVTSLVLCNAYVDLMLWLFLAKKPRVIEDDMVDLQPGRQSSGVGSLNDSTFVSHIAGGEEFNRQESRASGSGASAFSGFTKNTDGVDKESVQSENSRPTKHLIISKK